MPGGDRTGPLGLGPRTGREVGYCAGFGVPGYVNPRSGFGRGFGRGWSRGVGRGFWGRDRGFSWRDYNWPDPIYYRGYPQPSKEEEKAYLENMVKGLEEEIKSIRSRILEISNEKKES